MVRSLQFQRLLCAVLASVVVLAGPALAQKKNKAAPPPPDAKLDAKSKANAADADKTADQTIPDGPALNILIRRTLLTLNDANLSGNYTVLRDLAAPGFQSANDPAKLAGIFADLRKAKIDMAPIVYFDPKLVRQPGITKSGMLRLSGFMPTKPQQVNFDMLFQRVSGRWRLFGIAVNTTQVKAAAATPAAGGGKQKKK